MRLISVAILAFGYYMLLAGSIGVEQAVSGVILAAFTLVWSVWLRRRGDARRIGVSLGQAGAILRAFARLPRDAALVGGTLVRALFGATDPGYAADRPFHFGTVDDADEAGRRVAAVIAGSLTPDTIVVTVEPGGRARQHRVLDRPYAGGTEWLA